MKREELRNKMIGMIKTPQLASVATIKDGEPWVRYMVVQGDKDLNLYTTTFSQARKVEQIKRNNKVHVIVGGDPKNWETDFMNIEATAEVLTDLETKKNCWHEKLKEFFSGPEDPNYSVIRISPQVIEYTCSGAHKPEVYTVEA